MDTYIKGYMHKEAVTILPVIMVLAMAGSLGASGYNTYRAAQAEKQRQKEDLRDNRLKGGAGVGASLGGLLGYALADEDDKLKWGIKGAILGGGTGALAGVASTLNQQNV